MGRKTIKEEELTGIELEKYTACKVLKQIICNPKRLKIYTRRIKDATSEIEIDHIRRDAILKEL